MAEQRPDRTLGDGIAVPDGVVGDPSSGSPEDQPSFSKEIIDSLNLDPEWARLFIEAGFAPAQAIQIMTSNGAKILGVAQTLGTVEPGKLADLVVLRGNLTTDPAVIRSPTIVFKDGVGYDSAKLIASVQGRVGVN